MRRVYMVFLVCVTVACGPDRSSKGQHDGSGSGAARLDADQQILVLDAALQKAKRELATLMGAVPRDDKAIADKRGAIEAVEQTIQRLRQRSDPPSRP